MGGTVTIKVNSSWEEFLPSTEGIFTFSNEGPEGIFIREAMSEPNVRDTGFVYTYGERGSGIVEDSRG